MFSVQEYFFNIFNLCAGHWPFEELIVIWNKVGWSQEPNKPKNKK